MVLRRYGRAFLGVFLKLCMYFDILKNFIIFFVFFIKLLNNVNILSILIQVNLGTYREF